MKFNIILIVALILFNLKENKLKRLFSVNSIKQAKSVGGGVTRNKVNSNKPYKPLKKSKYTKLVIDNYLIK